MTMGQSSVDPDVVVIGGGPNGLTAAATIGWSMLPPKRPTIPDVGAVSFAARAGAVPRQPIIGRSGSTNRSLNRTCPSAIATRRPAPAELVGAA